MKQELDGLHLKMGRARDLHNEAFLTMELLDEEGREVAVQNKRKGARSSSRGES